MNNKSNRRLFFSSLLISATFFVPGFLYPGNILAQQTDGNSRNRLGPTGVEIADVLTKLSVRLEEVAGSVKSTGDVVTMEPTFVSHIEELTDRLYDIVNNMDGASVDDVKGLADLMNDAEVKRAMASADAAMRKLMESHPEVYAELEYIGRVHTLPIRNVIASLISSSMQVRLGFMSPESFSAEAMRWSRRGASNIAERMKLAMMRMAKGMTAIANSVNSVRDAEKAEPKIAALMVQIIDNMQAVVDNMGSMTIDESMAMQNFMEDPELKLAMEEADEAMANLRATRPEAAAKLEEIGQKHAEKMEGVMTRLMEKAMQMQNRGNGLGTE